MPKKNAIKIEDLVLSALKNMAQTYPPEEYSRFEEDELLSFVNTSFPNVGLIQLETAVRELAANKQIEVAPGGFPNHKYQFHFVYKIKGTGLPELFLVGPKTLCLFREPRKQYAYNFRVTAKNPTVKRYELIRELATAEHPLTSVDELMTALGYETAGTVGSEIKEINEKFRKALDLPIDLIDSPGSGYRINPELHINIVRE